MTTKYFEAAYNRIPYDTKQEIGFPDAFIFLTREQERFIMELFQDERDTIKKELLETIEEMKGLINEL